MLKTLATLVGYKKAPKATFVMKHPVKGTAALLAYKGVKNADAKSKAIIATAALAVPVGAWLISR